MVSGIAPSSLFEAIHTPAINMTYNLADGNSTAFHNGTIHSHELLYLRSHYSYMIFMFVILVVSAVVGTLGNLLVIVTIALVRSLRTYGNMFVLNLALADLVISTTVVPFNAVGALAGETVFTDAESDNMLCNVIGSVCAPACMSSMWNMCLISMNRFVLICYPHLYKRLFTAKTTFLMCFAIWFFCHVAHVPNHLGWGKISWNPDFYLCTFDVLSTHSYAIFYVFLGVLVPLVGVLYGYAAIFFKVRAVKMQMREHRRNTVLAQLGKSTASSVTGNRKGSTKGRDYSRGSSFTQEDVRLAKTLFMAFLIFFVCWLPFALLVLAGQPRVIPKWFYILAMSFAHGNSAMNPIIYGLNNEKFREGYMRVSGCVCTGRRLALGNSVGPDSTSHPRRSSLITTHTLKSTKNSSVAQEPL